MARGKSAKKEGELPVHKRAWACPSCRAVHFVNLELKWVRDKLRRMEKFSPEEHRRAR